MREAEETAFKVVDNYLQRFSPTDLAELWNLHNIHIYKARKQNITPKLIERLRELELIPAPPIRFRRTLEFEDAEETDAYDEFKARFDLSCVEMGKLVRVYLLNRAKPLSKQLDVIGADESEPLRIVPHDF